MSSRLGFAIRLWENFSVNPAVMGNFFESGKNKAAKGAGWALPLAVCMIQLGSNPTAHTAIRLWETFTLTFRWDRFEFFFSHAYGFSGSFYLSLGGGSM